MVTIKDVAKEAGVSVGTVSNVINGRKVSDKRKEKVNAAIAKLGYQVNVPARQTIASDSKNVIVILPNISNPYFSALLQSLEREITKVGMKTLLCLSDRDIKKEKFYIDMVERGEAKGIIGITYSMIDEYVTEDIPFISIDRHFGGSVTCVASDNYMGGRMAASQLSKTGSRNLLFIQTISSLDGEVKKRKEGFIDYCNEKTIPYACVEFSESQVQSIYSAFSSAKLITNVLASWLDEETGADGIFAGTDHLAYVICECLKQLGKKVPEDVQVIGFDGLRVMNWGELYVSSIIQDTDLVAKTSVASLMRRLAGERVASVTSLPVCFGDGKTTRKAE